MNLDRVLLSVLFHSNRSAMWKYLSGDSTTPASTMSLIMLLQLIQKRNPDLLAKWLTLSDFTIPPEVYLDQSGYWKGWVHTQHKVSKNVLGHLKKHYPGEDQKSMGKSREEQLCLYSAICRMRRKHLVWPTIRAYFVDMIRRIGIVSGDDRTDDQRYPFYRDNLSTCTCTEIFADADRPRTATDVYIAAPVDQWRFQSETLANQLLPALV